MNKKTWCSMNVFIVCCCIGFCVMWLSISMMALSDASFEMQMDDNTLEAVKEIQDTPVKIIRYYQNGSIEVDASINLEEENDEKDKIFN